MLQRDLSHGTRSTREKMSTSLTFCNPANGSQWDASGTAHRGTRTSDVIVKEILSNLPRETVLGPQTEKTSDNSRSRIRNSELVRVPLRL